MGNPRLLYMGVRMFDGVAFDHVPRCWFGGQYVWPGNDGQSRPHGTTPWCMIVFIEASERYLTTTNHDDFLFKIDEVLFDS